jgi:hypothetical protein
MDKSIFTDKSSIPGDKDMENSLGKMYTAWQDISRFVLDKHPSATLEWNYPGEKFGWSFRIKDKKRAIIYLLPRDKYFKVAFVFGQKAFDQIMGSAVSDEIKNELKSAKKYAEGRGIRLDVKNTEVIKDITELIEIKLLN